MMPFNIVLIDATEPFGYGHLFPRGTLRESFAGLARADLVAVTRADCVEASRLAEIRAHVRQFAATVSIIEVTHAPRALRNSDGEETPLDRLAQRRVVAFCGIGNPAGFRHTLATCNYELDQLRTFPDHHAFSRSDVTSLNKWAAQADVDAVLCTHKDLVKLRLNELGGKPLFALTIGLGFLSGEAKLHAQLLETCTAAAGESPR